MPPIRKIGNFRFVWVALRRKHKSEGEMMNMRVLGIIAILSCCAFATEIYSEPTLSASQAFQTRALFNLVVQKSKVLSLGKSRLETKSAFVTYTNEFFAGKTNALKVQFFTQPIVEEAKAKATEGRQPRNKPGRLCRPCPVLGCTKSD